MLHHCELQSQHPWVWDLPGPLGWAICFVIQNQSKPAGECGPMPTQHLPCFGFFFATDVQQDVLYSPSANHTGRDEFPKPTILLPC